MVGCLFLFQCLDPSACEYILMKKQMELLSTNPPSDSSQYVVVCIFLFQCVDHVICEQIWIKKQLEMFSIKSSK